ncbi:MAG: hypothetical protein HKN32_09505 [Flavobacteriales bacterium]|nr:hypothetical protein [Flavobacteriales bacterium]
MADQGERWYFLFITPDDKVELNERLTKKLRNRFHLAEAHSPSEVCRWLSAADIGLSAIPPLPSQKFRSPVKVGEYLLCGLPFITCRNVSEDDHWAEEKEVGIVVDELDLLSGKNIEKSVSDLIARDDLRSVCREVGLEYRSIERVHDAFTRALSSSYD